MSSMVFKIWHKSLTLREILSVGQHPKRALLRDEPLMIWGRLGQNRENFLFACDDATQWGGIVLIHSTCFARVNKALFMSANWLWVCLSQYIQGSVMELGVICPCPNIAPNQQRVNIAKIQVINKDKSGYLCVLPQHLWADPSEFHDLSLTVFFKWIISCYI